MKAMLLAAGFGTRLRPLTDNVPKCMVSIGGKPILEHNLLWLRNFGITDVLINLYYLPQVVINYFGDGSKWGIKINYSIEKQILGTSGGVKNVAWFFEEEPFVIWYSDNLCSCNLDRVHTFHHNKAGIATIVLYHREDVTQCGIVKLDDNNRILRFLEKPQKDQVFSHWVNAGIYIVEPEIINHIPADKPSDFGRDIFPKLLEDNKLLYGCSLIKGEKFWWNDNLDDLQRTKDDFEKKRIEIE
jgi:mannose-1-phosphate guanylyltransferase